MEVFGENNKCEKIGKMPANWRNPQQFGINQMNSDRVRKVPGFTLHPPAGSRDVSGARPSTHRCTPAMYDGDAAIRECMQGWAGKQMEKKKWKKMEKNEKNTEAHNTSF